MNKIMRHWCRPVSLLVMTAIVFKCFIDLIKMQKMRQKSEKRFKNYAISCNINSRVKTNVRRNVCGR